MNAPAQNHQQQVYDSIAHPDPSTRATVSQLKSAASSEAVSPHHPNTRFYAADPLFRFPCGFPANVDHKALANKAAAQPKLIQFFKKMSKGTVFQTKFVERVRTRCFTPSMRNLKLPQKTQTVLGLLQFRAVRADYWGIQARQKDLSIVPEVVFINDYYQELAGEALIPSDPMDYSRGSWSGLMSRLHPMEYVYVCYGYISNHSGGKANTFPFTIPHSGAIRQAYEDLFEQNSRADKAALAIWAFGSIIGCRWFLDYVYQHSPELYNRYYGELRYFDFQHNALLAETVPGNLYPEYEPLPFRLDAPTVTLSILHLLGNWALTTAGDLLANDFQKTELDFQRIDKPEPPDIGLMVGISESCNDLTTFLIGHTSLMDLYWNLSLLDETISALEELLANYKAHFELPGPFPAVRYREGLQTITTCVQKFAQDATPSRDLLPVVEKLSLSGGIIDRIDKTYTEQETLQGGRSSIKEQIAKLASEDPIANRRRIEKLYKAASEQDQDAEKAYQELCALSALLNDEVTAITQYAVTELHHSADLSASGDEHGEEALLADEIHSLVPKLEEAEEHNQHLAARVHQLEQENSTLKDAIDNKRSGLLADSLVSDVRLLLQRKLQAENALTVEESLTLLKALYPDIEILPSAWSSARNAQAFEYTDKLWSLLSTLAGDYLNAINGGQPDCEARKLFPANAYAANESEIVQNGALKRQREFPYEGETHYFGRHLRIGVKQDARKTVRVHFDIIAGKCVIAHCGEHLKLL